MKSLKEKIEVMTAHLQGHEIEGSTVDRDEWNRIDDPEFNWSHCDYRIAPIPESKAEQEEKGSEGKDKLESTKDVAPRCEHQIMRGKLVYALMEDGSTYHGDPHGRATCTIYLVDRSDERLSPAVSTPSPSPSDASEIQRLNSIIKDCVLTVEHQNEEMNDMRNEIVWQNSIIKEFRKALEAITRRVPIMTSTGDYREGQLHALEACSHVARAALQSTTPPATPTSL